MQIEYDRAVVTGCAGFIGFHLCKRLLDDGKRILGIDNLNEYYDVRLKWDRLKQLQAYQEFSFQKCNLEDTEGLNQIFNTNDVEVVINLAAQAGVRYSIQNPYAYINSNILGFMNVLECCRQFKVKHLVFASSSSVYGANKKMPFSTHQNVDHPVSLYAATKKANELMAHTYSHLYDLACTGLRFFTVYGPWGRPDMALFKFTKAILAGKEIKVFNHGKMKRDFTYIDDIVEGVRRIIGAVPESNDAWDAVLPDPGSSYARYKIYNIGNNNPVDLEYFIQEIEKALGKKANKEYLGLQPGDVPETYADIDDLIGKIDFRPKTSVADGIREFINWYISYYGKPETTKA